MAKDGDKSERRLSELLEPERLGAAAIVSAMVVGVVCFGFFVWVMTDPGEGFQTAVNRSRAVAPFIALLVALVTFMTVLWRGAINQQQANEDKRANDSKDEVELGIVFEKAHQYIKSNDLSEKELGVTMLETVAFAKKGRYASHALVSIGRQIQFAFGEETAPRSRLRAQVRNVFERLSQEGRTQLLPENEVFELDYSEDLEREQWNPKKVLVTPFVGMPSCKITCATILVNKRTEPLVNDPANPWVFVGCHISAPYTSGVIKSSRYAQNIGLIKQVSMQYRGCKFELLRIQTVGSKIENRTEYPKADFLWCDFTDAIFVSKQLLNICSFKNCFYVDGRPPNVIVDDEIHSIAPDVLKKIGIRPRSVVAPLSTSEPFDLG